MRHKMHLGALAMREELGIRQTASRDGAPPCADERPVDYDRSAVDWRALRHAIVAYIRHRGHSHDVAEDVAQDALVKLMGYVAEGRPASIYGLAYRIAATTLVDRLRAEARFGDPVDETHASEAPLPETIAADRQQVDLLRAALARMPVLRREVLIRRRLENQSHTRIAADLGLSLAAVEKHVVRGLCDLRNLMHDRATSTKAAT
jgi:RNA polymerase sigma factor (sigma-70 family)